MKGIPGLLGAVVLLLFASVAKADDIATVTLDFSHDSSIYHGYHSGPFGVSTLHGSLPTPDGELGQGVFPGFIFGNSYEWVESFRESDAFLQIWNYCSYEFPLPVQELLQNCGAALNVTNGQASDGDWIIGFPDQLPLDITFSPDGKSWTGVFVSGTYVSTSGTVLTITPEPGTSVLLLAGVGLFEVCDEKTYCPRPPTCQLNKSFQIVEAMVSVVVAPVSGTFIPGRV